MYYLKIILLKGCPYCEKTKKLLSKYNFKKEIITVDNDTKEKWKSTNMNTFPQIFLKKENRKDHLLIGGFNDISFIENKSSSSTEKNLSNIKNEINKKYPQLSEKATLRLLELFIRGR